MNILHISLSRLKLLKLENRPIKVGPKYDQVCITYFRNATSCHGTLVVVVVVLVLMCSSKFYPWFSGTKSRLHIHVIAYFYNYV